MVFFVNRFRQVAYTQGEADVLITLPLCLKGDAMLWYTDLPSETLKWMNNSLDKWEKQLKAEFLPNQGETAAKARKTRFRFESMADLSLTSYLRKKTQLLRDVGLTDELSIRFEIWQSLDPELISITPLKNNETLEQFS